MDMFSSCPVDCIVWHIYPKLPCWLQCFTYFIPSFPADYNVELVLSKASLLHIFYRRRLDTFYWTCFVPSFPADCNVGHVLSQAPILIVILDLFYPKLPCWLKGWPYFIQASLLIAILDLVLSQASLLTAMMDMSYHTLPCWLQCWMWSIWRFPANCIVGHVLPQASVLTARFYIFYPKLLCGLQSWTCFISSFSAHCNVGYISSSLWSSFSWVYHHHHARHHQHHHHDMNSHGSTSFTITAIYLPFIRSSVYPTSVSLWHTPCKSSTRFTRCCVLLCLAID